LSIPPPPPGVPPPPLTRAFSPFVLPPVAKLLGYPLPAGTPYPPFAEDFAPSVRSPAVVGNAQVHNALTLFFPLFSSGRWSPHPVLDLYPHFPYCNLHSSFLFRLLLFHSFEATDTWVCHTPPPVIFRHGPLTLPIVFLSPLGFCKPVHAPSPHKHDYSVRNRHSAICFCPPLHSVFAPPSLSFFSLLLLCPSQTVTSSNPTTL